MSGTLMALVLCSTTMVRLQRGTKRCHLIEHCHCLDQGLTDLMTTMNQWVSFLFHSIISIVFYINIIYELELLCWNVICKHTHHFSHEIALVWCAFPLLFLKVCSKNSWTRTNVSYLLLPVLIIWQVNWIREPTNHTINAEDYGAGPQSNYTLKVSDAPLHCISSGIYESLINQYLKNV